MEAAAIPAPMAAFAVAGTAIWGGVARHASLVAGAPARKLAASDRLPMIRTSSAQLRRHHVEGGDSERGASHDQQIDIVKVFKCIKERSWQTFTKEYNVWLYWGFTLIAIHNFVIFNVLFEFLNVLTFAAFSARSATVSAMSLHHIFIHINFSFFLQIIDILGQIFL